MDFELVQRCNELDGVRHDTMARADMKRKKLWGAAYSMRNDDVPCMTDNDVEVLVELVYLSILPAYRHITLLTYSTTLQSLPPDYKEYFTHLVTLARCLDTHGDCEIATDEDWVAWIDSM